MSAPSYRLLTGDRVAPDKALPAARFPRPYMSGGRTLGRRDDDKWRIRYRRTMSLSG